MVYYTSDFMILRRWTDKITLQHTAVRRKNYDNVLYYENVCSLRVSNFKTKSKYKYRWTGGQLQKYIKIIYYIRVVRSSNTDRHVQHTCCYCVFLVETENVQLGPEKKNRSEGRFLRSFLTQPPSRVHSSTHEYEDWFTKNCIIYSTPRRIPAGTALNAYVIYDPCPGGHSGFLDVTSYRWRGGV